MFKKMAYQAVISLLFFLLASNSANALPIAIGQFSWNEDLVFGPIFSVENFSSDSVISLGGSGISFANLYVDLNTDQGPSRYSFVNGVGASVLDPGNSSQTTDDLTSFSILSAALHLDQPLSGSFFVADLSGSSTELIYYDTGSSGASVPEPSTLLLVGSGLSAFWIWRNRSRRMS